MKQKGVVFVGREREKFLLPGLGTGKLGVFKKEIVLAFLDGGMVLLQLTRRQQIVLQVVKFKKSA